MLSLSSYHLVVCPAFVIAIVGQIDSAWAGAEGLQEDIVITAYNDVVSRKSLRTLQPGAWLGDEVINVYMKILQARNRQAVAREKPVPR